MSTSAPAAGPAPAAIDPVAAAQRLSIATCLGFGVGTVGVSIMLNAVTPYFPAFMSTVLGQSPALAGTLLTVSKLYDAVADVVIGRMSDRTRSRWGRRRPYLLVGALVSAVSFLMLFVPPRLDDFWLLAYMSAGLVVYSTGYSLFNVPYMAMPSEMTDGYHERTRLLGYRMVFVSIGQLLSGAGTAALIQRGGGGADGYALMGLVMSLIIFGAMTAAFFGTARARVIERSHAPARLPGGQLALLWRNRPFVLLAAAKVFQFFGFASIAVTGLLFLLNVVHVGYAGQAQLALCQNLFTFVSLPFWVRAGRVIGKRNTYLAGVALFVLGALSWLSAGPGITTLGIWLRGIPSGLGAGAMLLMAISMLADTMAYDRRLTGLHREGLLSAVIAVLEKTSFALGAALIGVMLTAAKYVPTTGGALAAQPASAVRALYLTFSVIPAAIFSLNLLCIWFYDLDEKKLQDDPA
ncbi:MAG: MFS transporter [Steroidobacteraceae bacterium]|nr:MFS transporter [Steroidobacteraceae bacterium]